MPDSFSYARGWDDLSADELYSFLKLRTDVFFVEQRIDETELDDRDREAATRHYWISDDAGTAAYLRTLVDDEPTYLDARRLIGRVVVRADRRGEGLARRLLDEVITRDGREALLLHSQEYIAPLYLRHGFEPFGDVYQEAGIPHISMYRAGR